MTEDTDLKNLIALPEETVFLLMAVAGCFAMGGVHVQQPMAQIILQSAATIFLREHSDEMEMVANELRRRADAPKDPLDAAPEWLRDAYRALFDFSKNWEKKT